jgi:hypothetical protein
MAKGLLTSAQLGAIISRMTRFRRRLLLSGLGGLAANAALAAIAALLVGSGVIKAPLPYDVVTVLTSIILAGFSLAEIPMMILAMRRLAAERPNNQLFVLGLNATFTFFAAVYGVPVLLLTGSMAPGLALCALGVVRLIASMLFVREPQAITP